MIKVMIYIWDKNMMRQYKYQINHYNIILITIYLYGVKVHVQEIQINMKMQSLGQTKHQLLILNMLMFRNLNKYEDAITWLDKALAIDTKHVFSLNEKGKCLRLLKKYNESLQLLDQALLINPQHLFSLQTKGDCLRDQQKYKESLIYYEKSLEIDPNNQYSKNQKEFCQKKLNQ
ncbi:unnamed protein product [Paramecium pentaurelia]|uniref:Tetratricopeptide repeat protein n=1 Tax=Paramecium pentaurelia TaxID=43138 RepID=A0A8S1YRJ3_9CILI|nr:unnamed protein product [Paramecium pentaurelia]